MTTTTILAPVNGVFSYIDFLNYLDDHFYGIHARETLDYPNYYAYDKNNHLIAFYNEDYGELWAIKYENIA